MKWMIVFFGIFCNTLASILVKMAITSPRKFPTIEEPLTILINWPFWMGLFFYGAAFLFYAAALERLPINVVHPILTSGAIALVALSSIIVFNEPFYLSTAIGILFVVSGVVLIASHI